ncbi:MAG: hypothetical protein HQK65_06660, partial [Desulfamplus sp.]|nr:hypothetical protein [Desulfamplus sp.]
MSKVSKIKQSRDSWKTKAVKRNEAIKYYKAELKRVKANRDKYKTQLHEAKQQLDEERKKNTLPAKDNKELLI